MSAKAQSMFDENRRVGSYVRVSFIASAFCVLLALDARAENSAAEVGGFTLQKKSLYTFIMAAGGIDHGVVQSDVSDDFVPVKLLLSGSGTLTDEIHYMNLKRVRSVILRKPLPDDEDFQVQEISAKPLQPGNVYRFRYNPGGSVDTWLNEGEVRKVLAPARHGWVQVENRESPDRKTFEFINLAHVESFVTVND